MYNASLCCHYCFGHERTGMTAAEAIATFWQKKLRLNLYFPKQIVVSLFSEFLVTCLFNFLDEIVCWYAKCVVFMLHQC